MIKIPSNVFALNCNGNFNDESGNGHNCTGIATLSYSQFGQCVNFNGTQYLGTQNNVDLSNTDKLTICFRIKFNETANIGTKIILEFSQDFKLNNSFMIAINDIGGVGRLEFVDKNNENISYIYSNYTYTNNSYGDNNWHFFAITNDRSINNKIRCNIYVDLINDSNHTNAIKEIVTGNYSSQKIFIGARNTSSLFFNGQLDEFKIYNKILNLEDIKRIYEGFSPLNG